MRYPQLDERLQAAADLFTACDLGADIGADHGRLSCYLLHTGKCQEMIVADISADSLSKAQNLLSLHKLDERAHYCVADGLEALSALDKKTNCVAICGMGGALVSKILLRGQEYLHDAALVLSSHTDIPLVRKTLSDIGYHIADERLERAKGRFYIIMRAEKGERTYSERELYLGPCLLHSHAPLWLDYLHWREGVVSCEQGHTQELSWIREEIARETGDCKNGI